MMIGVCCSVFCLEFGRFLFLLIGSNSPLTDIARISKFIPLQSILPIHKPEIFAFFFSLSHLQAQGRIAHSLSFRWFNYATVYFTVSID